MADPNSKWKRYTPPIGKKAPGNHRRSGDRASGQQKNDLERSQPQATGVQTENATPKIITLKNCSTSEAYQLLSQRWTGEMRRYNDPKVDLSERPIMYYGGNIWGRLPHQILASANNMLPPPSMSPMDYRTEVRKGLLMPRSSSGSNN